MWSRSRASDNSGPHITKPVIDDGVSLLDGPVRLDWISAEITSYRMFFPESFTASYAYPLVLYIHDETRSEKDLERWFPKVSDQNFLAAAVRAPFPDTLGLPSRYSWHKDPVRIAGRLVTDAIESISALWRVHPDRLYLMGDGLGAELALELVLQKLRFACGIAVTPTRIPDLNRQYNQRLNKRLLLFDNPCITSQLQASLTSSTVELTCSSLSDPAQCSRAINHWLMSAIPGTIW